MSDRPRPTWLPLVDLRAVTRDTNLVTTRISVRVGGDYFPWIEFGSLEDQDSLNVPPKSILSFEEAGRRALQRMRGRG